MWDYIKIQHEGLSPYRVSQQHDKVGSFVTLALQSAVHSSCVQSYTDTDLGVTMTEIKPK